MNLNPVAETEAVPSETAESLAPGETAGEVIIGSPDEDADVPGVEDEDSALNGFFGTKVGKFISINPGVSVLILVLVITIIVLVIILITRSIKYNRPRKHKAGVRQYQGKGPTF